MALVAFAVLGLIAVTVIYVIDVPGRDTDEMRHGLTLLAMTESLIAIWVANRYLELTHEVLAYLGVVALGFLTVAVSLLPERIEPPPPRSGVMRWLRQVLGAKIAALEPLPPPTNAQLRAEIERRRILRRLGMKPEELPKKWKKRVKLLPMAALFVATVVVGAIYATFYHHWVGWSIWLAWGLAGLGFGVARTTERFWPYGLAVFFSVALFGAWLNIVRLTDSPELSPAALLRTGNEATAGVVGLFIARTDDRYWLGAVTMGCTRDEHGHLVPDRLKQASGRIFSIPRSQVIDDTVGARSAMAAVGDAALAQLGELVQRQPPGGAPAPGAKPPATPSGADGVGTTDGMAADSPAAVPRTLAVSGRCMHGPPRLTGLSPSTAAPGDRVEITGTDLGFDPGEEDMVTVNGTRAAAPTRTWQNGRVVFTVPAVGARRAVVRVVVRGLTSNARVLRIAHAR